MPAMKHVNRDDLVADYKDLGLSVSEIAEKHGLSGSTVNYHLNKAGIKLDRSRRRPWGSSRQSSHGSAAAGAETGKQKLETGRQSRAAKLAAKDSTPKGPHKCGMVTICITEERLNNWWNSLPLDAKGQIFEEAA